MGLMSADRLVTMARRYVDKPCTYALGKGGIKANSDVPWSGGECDCSGFVAWCMGVSRKTDNPLYVKLNGGWIETTAVWTDATVYKTGLFYQIAKPAYGCIVVYPDAAGHQGHIGIISEVNDQNVATKVVHCASRNPLGRAIQETVPDVFTRNPQAIFAWYEGVADGP